MVERTFRKINWDDQTSTSQVLLDVEINTNNRPLTYIDKVIQCPILTPNCFGRNTKMVDGNKIEGEE